MEKTCQKRCPVTPEFPPKQHEQNRRASINHKQCNAPAGILLTEEQVKRDFHEWENGTSLRGWLVRGKAKRSGRDPIDGQLVPAVVDISGLPYPRGPKPSQHQK